jgi:hypothetical protein
MKEILMKWKGMKLKELKIPKGNSRKKNKPFGDYKVGLCGLQMGMKIPTIFITMQAIRIISIPSRKWRRGLTVRQGNLRK